MNYQERPDLMGQTCIEKSPIERAHVNIDVDSKRRNVQ